MKKYNKIVSTFTKTIKKLEDLSKGCVALDKTLDIKIRDLEYEKRMVISEGDMASTTADKLKTLFKK